MVNNLFQIFSRLIFSLFQIAGAGMKYGILCAGLFFIGGEVPVFSGISFLAILEDTVRAEDEFTLDLPEKAEAVGETDQKQKAGQETKKNEPSKGEIPLKGQKKTILRENEAWEDAAESEMKKKSVEFSRNEMKNFPPISGTKREDALNDDFSLDLDLVSEDGGKSSPELPSTDKSFSEFDLDVPSLVSEDGGKSSLELPSTDKSSSEFDLDVPSLVSENGGDDPSDLISAENSSGEFNFGISTDSPILSERKEENINDDFSLTVSDSEKNSKSPKLNPEESFREADIPAFSSEELALRKKIRRTLKIYSQISLSSEENRPIDIISYVMPYGCDAEIFFGSREGNVRVNAIGALCWNVPMGDESAFTNSREKLVPRLGYGIQQYSGQLLAALALARVSVNYRFPAGWAIPVENSSNESWSLEKRTLEADGNAANGISPKPKGKKRFGIRNLVEFEQKNCRWGSDLSLTLIGLSYYLPKDAEWETADGEKWSLERLVENELARPMIKGEAASTNQLLGLLCAIRCQQMKAKHVPLSGAFARAETYLRQFQDYVLELQNEIGIWHPEFFLKKGAVPDQPTEMLISSGHILRWLVSAASRNELANPKIFKAVSVINELLEYQLAYWDPANASGTEIEGIMTALHALTIYEKRRFRQTTVK